MLWKKRSPWMPSGMRIMVSGRSARCGSMYGETCAIQRSRSRFVRRLLRRGRGHDSVEVGELDRVMPTVSGYALAELLNHALGALDGFSPSLALAARASLAGCLRILDRCRPVAAGTPALAGCRPRSTPGTSPRPRPRAPPTGGPLSSGFSAKGHLRSRAPACACTARVVVVETRAHVRGVASLPPCSQ